MANEYYFPWYPAHYRRDAGHLDHVSDSCYRRLLDAYMEGGEPIKKDAVRLMFIMRVSPEQFALVWPQIEGFFELDPKGYLHHKRCNIELDRQDTLTKHKSLGGLRSAAKRKEQREQYQLLGNSSSTAVQQQSDDGATALPPREGNVREGNVIKETEVLNGESVPASRSRASAATLPRGWIPSADQIQFAERMGLMNGSVSKEATKFEAYWTVGTGKGTRRTEKGWSQTWINWINKAANDPRNSRGHHGQENQHHKSPSDSGSGFAGLRAQARQAARGSGEIDGEN